MGSPTKRNEPAGRSQTGLVPEWPFPLFIIVLVVLIVLKDLLS
jgi:hypothetical protein